MPMDWESEDSLVLLNPSYSAHDQTRFSKILSASQNQWPAHLWLATSGSTAVKWVGLSKEAILTSAAAVNQHLQVTKQDRWATALPDFHVGGLGIWARSHLSGAAVDDYKKEFPKWEPRHFYQFLIRSKSTLTALVPTQLHDLVQMKLEAPPDLRAIIIGGGQLTTELFESARALNWKVMPSYGMTECASQIATASIGKSALQVLPHLEVCIMDQRLAFKGKSLLSTYAVCDEKEISFTDPKVNGWFISEDRGAIQNDVLTIFGRADQLIKIGGENVDIAALENTLQSLRLKLGIHQEVVLLALANERIGHEVVLALAGLKESSVEQRIVTEFNRQVLPFERIRQVYWVESFPKSSLSKLLRRELLTQLTQSKLL